MNNRFVKDKTKELITVSKEKYTEILARARNHEATHADIIYLEDKLVNSLKYSSNMKDAYRTYVNYFNYYSNKETPDVFKNSKKERVECAQVLKEVKAAVKYSDMMLSINRKLLLQVINA